MSGSNLVAVNTTNAVGDVREWVEGDPKQFVLRGNAECERLMLALQGLGVEEFDCIFWRDSFGTASCIGRPYFKSTGVRITTRHLDAVSDGQNRLSSLLDSAIETALEDCDCAESDLMVRFHVSLGAINHGITAFVQVIDSLSQLEGGDPLYMV